MFTITALAALAGIAAGYAFKGRLGRIGSIALSARRLVFAALAIMVFGSFVDLGAGPDRALIFLGYGLVALFLVANVTRFSGALRVGLLILALGWSLNATVIFLNGGMPLSRAAYAASGRVHAPTPGTEGFFKIVIADEKTVLSPLGDVIPVRAVGKVLSAGDLVLMLGLAVSIAAAMRGRQRDPSLRVVSGSGTTVPRRESALRVVSSEAG